MRFLTAAAIVGVSYAQKSSNRDIPRPLSFIEACPEIASRCNVPTTSTASSDEIAKALECVHQTDLASVTDGPCRAALSAIIGSQVPLAGASPEILQTMSLALNVPISVRVGDVRQRPGKFRTEPTRGKRNQRHRHVGPYSDDKPRRRFIDGSENRTKPEFVRRNATAVSNLRNRTSLWDRMRNRRSSRSQEDEKREGKSVRMARSKEDEDSSKDDAKSVKSDRKSKDDDRKDGDRKSKKDDRKSEDKDRKSEDKDRKSEDKDRKSEDKDRKSKDKDDKSKDKDDKSKGDRKSKDGKSKDSKDSKDGKSKDGKSKDGKSKDKDGDRKPKDGDRKDKDGDRKDKVGDRKSKDKDSDRRGENAKGSTSRSTILRTIQRARFAKQNGTNAIRFGNESVTIGNDAPVQIQQISVQSEEPLVVEEPFVPIGTPVHFEQTSTRLPNLEIAPPLQNIEIAPSFATN